MSPAPSARKQVTNILTLRHKYVMPQTILCYFMVNSTFIYFTEGGIFASELKWALAD